MHITQNKTPREMTERFSFHIKYPLITFFKTVVKSLCKTLQFLYTKSKF
jgi:hypothetical protein